MNLVLNRLLYGLESINLKKSDVQKLETYQRSLLRQILHLPERVASSAIYVLSGQLPVEAEIHKRRLSLYGNIVRKDCIERELAYRQLALKDSASKSWFVSLQEVLHRYGLPNAQKLLDSPPEKLGWKVKVRQHVNEYWRKSIIEEAEKKSTLEYLNIASYTPGKVHPVWTHCKYNSNSLLKAYVQVKLSCGTYILQSIRAKFNQYQVSRLCPLCKESDETLEHFILHCGALQPTRQFFTDALHELVKCDNDEELLRLILYPSMTCMCTENRDESRSTRIYLLTRSLCYALHVQRNTLLGS